MKRIVSIVLLVFFMVGNCHAIINVHYCGGEFQSISLVTKSKACSMCGMKSSKKSCCKDVQKLLKADDFSKAQTNYQIGSLLEFLSPYFFTVGNTFYKLKKIVSVFFDYGPDIKIPIFIRFCAIII